MSHIYYIVLLPDIKDTIGRAFNAVDVTVVVIGFLIGVIDTFGAITIDERLWLGIVC